jgi:hypothetical protein
MNDGKMKTQPARPFSEGIAHPFSPTTFDELPASSVNFRVFRV